MANTDELLAKAQKRLEKKSETNQPRRIQRTGPTRPWQENLESSSKQEVAATSSTSEAKPTPTQQTETPSDKEPGNYGIITESLRNNSLSSKKSVSGDSSLNAPELSQLNDAVDAGAIMGVFKFEHPTTSSNEEKNYATITESFSNNFETSSETVSKSLRNNSEMITEQFRNDNTPLGNNSVTKQKGMRNDKVTNYVTPSVTISEQLRNNNFFNQPTHVNRLSGHKLKIVQTIFDICQERGALNTGPVSREVFCSRTGISGEVIRVTTTRLITEGFLQIVESRRGSGGYTIYELNPTTHSQLVSGQYRIAEHKRNNSVTERVTGNETNPLYSSNTLSNSLINNTTIPNNSFKDRIELPPDLIPTGIKLANIAPVVNSEADLERINESLAAYAFDYSRNGIIKTGVFYGVIKAGRYYISDEYNREMAKERQLQDLATKAREEASRQNIPTFTTIARSKAEEEFEKEYSMELVQKTFKKMDQITLSHLEPMIKDGNLEYVPFKNTFKSQFISIRMAELEAEASRG